MIRRIPTMYSAATFAAALMLLNGVAQARSSSSSKASSFSPATTACMKRATQQKKLCKFSMSPVDCKAEFDTALENCFAKGRGVTCATSCVTKKDACDVKGLAAAKKCRKSCKTSPDPTCKIMCKQQASSCKTSFASCLAKCQQL